jgi:hypothetical protein
MRRWGETTLARERGDGTAGVRDVPAWNIGHRPQGRHSSPPPVLVPRGTFPANDGCSIQDSDGFPRWSRVRLAGRIPTDLPPAGHEDPCRSPLRRRQCPSQPPPASAARPRWHRTGRCDAAGRHRCSTGPGVIGRARRPRASPASPWRVGPDGQGDQERGRGRHVGEDPGASVPDVSRAEHLSPRCRRALFAQDAGARPTCLQARNPAGHSRDASASRRSACGSCQGRGSGSCCWSPSARSAPCRFQWRSGRRADN